MQKNSWKKINHAQSEMVVYFGTVSWKQHGGSWVRWGRFQQTLQGSAITAGMLWGERSRSGTRGKVMWVLICLAHKHMWVRVKGSCQVWAISITFHSQGQVNCHHLINVTLSHAPKLCLSTPALSCFCFPQVLKHNAFSEGIWRRVASWDWTAWKPLYLAHSVRPHPAQEWLLQTTPNKQSTNLQDMPAFSPGLLDA